LRNTGRMWTKFLYLPDDNDVAYLRCIGYTSENRGTEAGDVPKSTQEFAEFDNTHRKTQYIDSMQMFEEEDFPEYMPSLFKVYLGEFPSKEEALEYYKNTDLA